MKREYDQEEKKRKEEAETGHYQPAHEADQHPAQGGDHCQGVLPGVQGKRGFHLSGVFMT